MTSATISISDEIIQLRTAVVLRAAMWANPASTSTSARAKCGLPDAARFPGDGRAQLAKIRRSISDDLFLRV